MNEKAITATAGYTQLAYVSNDFDRGLQTLGATHGIEQFLEMRDLTYPTGPNRAVTCHVALAFVGDMQFELIAPLSGDVDVYRNYLPSGRDFALRFHHVARRYPALGALEVCCQRWRDAGRVLPIDAQEPGGTRYFYGDFRAELGHYVECIYYPPEAAEFQKQIPRSGTRFE